MNEFYEDDEPVAEVVAAFKRGRKGKTRRPGIRNVKSSGGVSISTNPGAAANIQHTIHGPNTAHIQATR